MSDAIVFRADRSTYIIMAIIFGLPTACMVAIVCGWPDWNALAGLLTAIAADVFVYAWLRSFKITITPDLLRYDSLTQHRKMRRVDIRRISFSVEPFRDAGGPTVRLTVDGQGEESIVINAKVFSREAIRTVRALQPSATELEGKP